MTTPIEQESFLLFFPEEIRRQVLSSLSPFDLGNCCLVSKAWNRVASDPILWKLFITFTNIPIQLETEKSKDFIKKIYIWNEKSLLKRIQSIFLSSKGKERSELNLYLRNSDTVIKVRGGQIQSQPYRAKPEKVYHLLYEHSLEKSLGKIEETTDYNTFTSLFSPEEMVEFNHQAQARHQAIWYASCLEGNHAIELIQRTGDGSQMDNSLFEKIFAFLRSHRTKNEIVSKELF